MWEIITDGVWDTVGTSTSQANPLHIAATTASEITLTATLAAQTLLEEHATVSTSVTTPAEQPTVMSVEPVVQLDSSFDSPSFSALSSYSGACSEGFPYTADST
jgi:hypothetical protein